MTSTPYDSGPDPDSEPDPDSDPGSPGSDDAYAPGAAPRANGDADLEVEGEPTASGESAELAAQQDRYLRLAAEYDNYRRRTMRERQDDRARSQGELVKQMIDALDDLARFAHVDPATMDAATVVQGAELVERKLHKALLAAGLEIVNPEELAFDPAVHEAVATEPAAAEEEDHSVARVYQVGYRFGGQLLRPARVVVRQWNG